MPCYHPITGWYASDGSGLTTNRKYAYIDRPLTVACGRCIGCRLEKSKQWATRCMHEAQLHTHNCFITLTYNNENLPQPEYPTLVPRHFTLFMKRLRKKYGNGIRYYHCGEYGEINERPHYHAIIFNHDFADKTLHRVSPRGDKIYTSQTLEDLWGHGFVTTAAVTFESAAYTARYVLKKQTGKNAADHYTNEDGLTRAPEYATMSRRPGIGQNWIDKFHEEVSVTDSVVLRGRQIRPPRYYDQQMEAIDPIQSRKTKGVRKQKSKNNADDQTPGRLKAREKVQEAKQKTFTRNLTE